MTEAPPSQRPLNVLFCTAPQMGHSIPTLNLAEAVARRGHHVQFLSADYAEPKLGPKAAKVGVRYVPVSTGEMTAESALEWEDNLNEVYFLALRDLWAKPVAEIVAEAKPDVVVADFSALAAMQAAVEQGVPLVVSIPGPVKLLAFILGLEDGQLNFTLLGVHFGCVKFSKVELAALINIKRIGEYCIFLRSYFAHAIVIVHSFWGLDPPMLLPPNIKVVGPVLPPGDELHSRLQQEHPELVAWLHTPGTPAAIYISTGSNVTLHPWQVRVIFEAVKKAGVRAVWSLKKQQQACLPSEGDASFWIDAWLPQAELLQDPVVKAAICHCGWGGALECCTGGKPIIALPFFADQPDIARMLVRAGAAELLGKMPPLTMKAENLYIEGMITVDHASEVIQRVVTQPAYANAARRLRQLGAATGGGAGEAAAHIERAARCGVEHLVSPAVTRNAGSNPFHGLLVLALGGLAAALWPLTHALGAAALGLGACAAALGLSVRRRRRAFWVR